MCRSKQGTTKVVMPPVLIQLVWCDCRSAESPAQNAARQVWRFRCHRFLSTLVLLSHKLPDQTNQLVRKAYFHGIKIYLLTIRLQDGMWEANWNMSVKYIRSTEYIIKSKEDIIRPYFKKSSSPIVQVETEMASTPSTLYFLFQVMWRISNKVNNQKI